MRAQRFHLMRGELESLLSEEPEEKARLEMAVYDFMVRAKELHELHMDSDLEQSLVSDDDARKSALYRWRAQYRHDPAFLFVLNADPKIHSPYFQGGERRIPPAGIPFLDARDELRTADLDGAVVLLPAEEGGTVYGIRIQLTSIPIHPVLELRYDGTIPDGIDPDDDALYGFRQPVNTRHRSALGASFHLDGTVVYTLGEDADAQAGGKFLIRPGHIRRYHAGRITFSTHEAE